MAGQSVKKQAAQNKKSLTEIHRITWISYAIFFISNFYFNRPKSSKLFILTAFPVFGSLFIIEKTGRPKEDSKGVIIRPGADLHQEGLTEYLFDIIYFTVGINFLTVLFNSGKPWWFYWAVPIFAGYKLYSLFKAGKEMFGGGAKSGQQVNEFQNKEAEKSKRQQKREARGDKPKMKYR